MNKKGTTMNKKLAIFLILFLRLLPTNSFAQGFGPWESLYKDNVIKVEVSFKIVEASCTNKKKHKIQYRVTGKLNSFDDYLVWTTDYIDCNGNSFFQEHSLNISSGNSSANGSVEAAGDTWTSQEDEFLAEKIITKFYDVHTSRSPSIKSGIKRNINSEPITEKATIKSTVKLADVGVVMTARSFTGNAQKIAHVNLDSLISIMPESKGAQQSVKAYAKQLEQQVTAMQTELQTKYAEFQEKSKDMAGIVRVSKEKELNDLNTRIQEFQEQAKTDYQKKTDELSKPIYDKAKKAIGIVAKENGYRYALDTSTGLVLYFEPADDIFALVVKKLGITPPR